MPSDKKEEIEDFKALDWCKAVLEQPSEWRRRSQRADFDNELLCNLLWSSHTIRAWQLFYRGPHHDNMNPRRGEVRLLLSLARGLVGHKTTCHGGILATIADEAMADLADVELGGHAVTREMTNTYEKPVLLPGIFVAKAWSEDEVGEGEIMGSEVGSGLRTRKIWVKCHIKDGEGTVYVKSKGLFIKSKAVLSRV